MKKVVFLCLLLLLTFGNTATAANWQYGITTDNGTYIFFDGDTININQNGCLDVWVNCIFSKTKNPNRENQIIHQEYDVVVRKFRLLNIYTYDKNGNQINKNTGATKWVEIVPGSYAETLYKTISRYYIDKTKRETQTL